MIPQPIKAMKKLYDISYEWTGGERSIQTTSIDELSRWLDEAIENPHVIQSSIKLSTTEVPV